MIWPIESLVKKKNMISSRVPTATDEACLTLGSSVMLVLLVSLAFGALWLTLESLVTLHMTSRDLPHIQPRVSHRQGSGTSWRGRQRLQPQPGQSGNDLASRHRRPEGPKSAETLDMYHITARMRLRPVPLDGAGEVRPTAQWRMQIFRRTAARIRPWANTIYSYNAHESAPRKSRPCFYVYLTITIHMNPIPRSQPPAITSHVFWRPPLNQLDKLVLVAVKVPQRRLFFLFPGFSIWKHGCIISPRSAEMTVCRLTLVRSRPANTCQ